MNALVSEPKSVGWSCEKLEQFRKLSMDSKKVWPDISETHGVAWQLLAGFCKNFLDPEATGKHSR